jgi:hypothetical protein
MMTRREGVPMLLPQYPEEMRNILYNLHLNTTADSVLLFHRDGALCAAQGNYTNKRSMDIITQIKYAFLSGHFTSDMNKTLPKLGYKRESLYNLFYASIGQHHVLSFVLLQGVPIGLLKKLTLQAIIQLEPLVRRE